MTLEVRSLRVSSPIRRSTASASDSTLRMWPMPLQRGQVWCADSPSDGRSRCRDISSRPKREILPIWTRARSMRTASRSRFSTSRWLRCGTHVDEVDHDEAAQVAEAQLPGDFLGCFQVGRVGRCLDVAALGGARRVDVDGHQRLGVIDHDAAAGWQFDRVGEGRLDLALDLVAGEQRHRVVVLAELAQVLRHRPFDELAGLLVGLVVVDQDLADVVGEVVAQGADDGVAVLEDQEGRGAADDGLLDRLPDPQQVVHVPLEFFGGAADAGRADDHAHALGDLDAVAAPRASRRARCR